MGTALSDLRPASAGKLGSVLDGRSDWGAWSSVRGRLTLILKGCRCLTLVRLGNRRRYRCGGSLEGTAPSWSCVWPALHWR